MSVTRFHVISTLRPSEVMAVLTDFSADRVRNWPSIDAEHFQVHDLGASWAEVTEGTAAAWERARYEWDMSERRVTVTTHESKVFGEGGGWIFQLTPENGGTRVEVELTRVPHTVKQRLIAALLPIVGPATFRKAFAGPLKAASAR